MSCLSPLIMSVCDFKKISPDGLVTSNTFLENRARDLGWKINKLTHIGYKIVSSNSRELVLENIPDYIHLKDIEVPCGNCIQCRLKYSKDWAVRCSMEASQYLCNYFVTLSYDDDHISLGKFGNGTLVRDHFTQFIKSLRQKFKREFNFIGVRFFGCGEYGDQTSRPHYHVILFNCPIPDLQHEFVADDGTISYHRNGLGDLMYWSKFIQDVWKYGNITIDDCNYNTEAYVSRYILKKQKGRNSKVYKDKLGILPPFIGMSLKPGIGELYFQNNKKKLLEEPNIILPRSTKEPLITGLPRYYQKKIKFDDPYAYQKMIDKAKENTLAIRSLLQGKQLINENRSLKEDRMSRKMEAFARDI